MANVSADDFPSPHIVLERVDPARNIARYYVLSIEPTLFAKHTLIRRRGRIGCLGRERLQFFGIEDASRASAWARPRLRPGAASRTPWRCKQRCNDERVRCGMVG